MALATDLLAPDVELARVNDYIAQRRFLCAGLTLLLFFFRVVRLSTVVCLALKLTWALVHWFVTFSVYYRNVPSPVVWRG